MLTLVAAGLPALSVIHAPHARAAASCPAGGCLVTIDARDFATGNPLPHFSYIVNVDNTKLPSDPLAISTESNSPIVTEGNEVRNSFHVPAGRYLISVRGVDHKMWGAYVTLPNPSTADGSLTARIDLTEQSDAHPLPLGKIRVFVFNDNAWTNGAPDTEEAGLQGFQVGLEEQTHSAVTVDYNNNPLCGGDCLTAGDGFVQIDNLGPATYFIDVHPPDRAVQQRPGQPVVPDHHDRRRPAAAGLGRGGQRRHRRARRAALGAAEQPHRVLVRFRLLAAGRSPPPAPVRSPGRRATGWSGRRTPPAPTTTRCRTRSSR